MADVATHNDIISALDGGDNEFAAVLLKDRLFHEPTDHKSWHLLARYFIDIEMAPFAYPVAQACVQREPTWRNLMMLGAAKGDMIEIIVTGEDAEPVIENLAAMVEDGFGEP